MNFVDDEYDYDDDGDDEHDYADNVYFDGDEGYDDEEESSNVRTCPHDDDDCDDKQCEDGECEVCGEHLCDHCDECSECSKADNHPEIFAATDDCSHLDHDCGDDCSSGTCHACSKHVCEHCEDCCNCPVQGDYGHVIHEHICDDECVRDVCSNCASTFCKDCKECDACLNDENWIHVGKVSLFQICEHDEFRGIATCQRSRCRVCLKQVCDHCDGCSVCPNFDLESQTHAPAVEDGAFEASEVEHSISSPSNAITLETDLANSGTYWTREEDEILLAGYCNKLPFEAIAADLGRTTVAIVGRIQKLCFEITCLVPLQTKFQCQEKNEWDQLEIVDLVTLHSQGTDVDSMASSINRALSDVLHRLVFSRLAVAGSLEDVKYFTAKPSSSRWSAAEIANLRFQFLKGANLNTMAIVTGKSPVSCFTKLCSIGEIDEDDLGMALESARRYSRND